MCALCHIITASAAPAHTYLHTFDWKVQPQRRKACKCTFNLALTRSHIKSTSLSGRAVQQLVHRSLFSKLDTLTGAYSSLQVLLWNSRGRRKSAHSEVYILYIIRFAFCGRNWVLDAQENIPAVLFWREWKLNSVHCDWQCSFLTIKWIRVIWLTHLKSVSFHSCNRLFGRKKNYHQKVCL